MTRIYNDFIKSKTNQYGAKFDASDLSRQFIDTFESQERIKVQLSSGEVKSGTVGITTGWKPVFLLMLRKNSRGSSWTLTDNDKII